MFAVEALDSELDLQVNDRLPEASGRGAARRLFQDVEAWISQIDSQLSANKRPNSETIQALRKRHSPA